MENPQFTNSATELMMQEYLNSMKLMIQAQRDVMLSFLGQNPAIGNAVPYHSSQHTLIQQSALIERPVIAKQELEPISQPAHAKPIVPQIDVMQVLLQIVSDKTGYPQEMLGMELDLEADLSIDSIKRVEIISTLRIELGGFNHGVNNEDAMMEQLAGIKTLNGLVKWINDNAAPPSVTTAVNIDVEVKNSQSKVSLDELKATILSVVSEKTGYPQEMLGMDLDLEADLSIDSIKRVEIIGELRLKIGFSKNQDQDDSIIEKLAAIKTLNGLVNWISE